MHVKITVEYVAISKKMVADINRLIEIDPQMLYRGNTDEQRTELQAHCIYME